MFTKFGKNVYGLKKVSSRFCKNVCKFNFFSLFQNNVQEYVKSSLFKKLFKFQKQFTNLKIYDFIKCS